MKRPVKLWPKDKKNRHDETVDALIVWLRSQDISPRDAIVIMAKTICVAAISITADRGGYLPDAVDDVERASRLVLDEMEDLIKRAKAN